MVGSVLPSDFLPMTQSGIIVDDWGVPQGDSNAVDVPGVTGDPGILGSIFGTIRQGVSTVAGWIGSAAGSVGSATENVITGAGRIAGNTAGAIISPLVGPLMPIIIVAVLGFVAVAWLQGRR